MLVSEQRHIHSWVLGVGWGSEPCIFRYIHPGPDHAMCQTERRKHRCSHFLHKQWLSAEMRRPHDKRGWFTVVRRADHLPSCGLCRGQVSGDRGTEHWEYREETWTWVGQWKSSWRQWKVSWLLGAEWEIARWGGWEMGGEKAHSAGRVEKAESLTEVFLATVSGLGGAGEDWDVGGQEAGSRVWTACEVGEKKLCLLPDSTLTQEREFVGCFFFFGYHFLNISLLLNETHWLKKSNQDKTVVDCPFRLKTEDFKDGEKIHWVKFF